MEHGAKTHDIGPTHEFHILLSDILAIVELIKTSKLTRFFAFVVAVGPKATYIIISYHGDRKRPTMST